MTAEHRFVHVEGARLHLLEVGRGGRPVLLLHGVLGHAWMWHAVAPRLEGAGRVLALDLRGYGDSQWAPDGEYTTETHAADVAAVLEQVAGERADVVGFSWGGLIGLALASRRPELVRRLVMVDIPPSSALAEHDVPPIPPDVAGHAEAVAAERRLSPRAADEVLDVIAAHATRPSAGGRLARKHDPVFLARWPFRADDRWDELAALRHPLLIVHAAESPVLSAGDVARMQAAAPGARVVRIEDSGHLVPVEQPVRLAEALLPFLTEAGG